MLLGRGRHIILHGTQQRRPLATGRRRVLSLLLFVYVAEDMDIVPCYSVASRYTEPNPVAITHTYDQGPKGQAAKADESNLTSHSALDNTVFHFPLQRLLISAAPMFESKILATH